MNKVILQGHLAADPEIKKYTKDGKESKLARICIVNQCQIVNETSNPEPLYMYGTAFGSVANYIKKAFKKGSRILIEGEFRPNNYEKDGKKIYSYQLIIRHTYFDGLNRGGNNISTESSTGTPQSTSDTSLSEEINIPSEEDAFMAVSPEEMAGLPFSDIN